MTFRPEIGDLIASALRDCETGWTLGAYGALASFRWTADEPCRPLADGRYGLITPRGGIGLRPRQDLVPFAYETAFGADWSHAVALCLPGVACAAPGRNAVTEIGRDRQALCAEDRDAVLFDLGFGLGQAEIGLRARGPKVLAFLRQACGGSAPSLDDPRLASEIPADLTWIVSGPLGRIEIPAGVSTDPLALRLFLVPRMLRLRRSHPATAPIPAGLVPVAHFLPPHPARRASGEAIAFDAARHAAFEALLARWGDPRLVAAKRHALGFGPPPDLPADRWTRGAERVGRAQAAYLGGSPSRTTGRGANQGGTP
ncbi:DUF6925 family protein [Methylobacterium soli]|uniref:Uncharacterized protein n=1 Tax=Methylobacterium soli TaxID=553447 RepID=A0A6L3SZ00_9HYPH|nr:hypothetical protein [Methylobacterium soli]KAB1078835.1 hypothetical protein F6X53_12530 [Methylobacterium soli]GJE44903.1 hypothetical protein AEGHOMDF_4095 [Methylobacterium soli]